MGIFLYYMGSFYITWDLSWPFLVATVYVNIIFVVLEPIFVFGMSYMAYLSAELFHFSGIIR